MENIKKFSSKGISITREDYESLPLPMCAYEFNDEQMQTLVENIAKSRISLQGSPRVSTVGGIATTFLLIFFIFFSTFAFELIFIIKRVSPLRELL